METIERFVRSVRPADFWFGWATCFVVVMPMWMYGEMGTLHGWSPYAPVFWLVSFIGAVALGISAAMRF